jgi:ADP-ribose pyrophosphatase YjhB (NUDIX family)
MILLNEEQIRGNTVIKFPGGGLHLGEGTIDCIKREWKEELGVDVEVIGHFYTTDFFQLSAFDDSQVISIYYNVNIPSEQIIANTEPNERTYWMDMGSISAEAFTLPIDKFVGNMLYERFNR